MFGGAEEKSDETSTFIVPLANEEDAKGLFEGGSQLKVVIASSNVGNAMITDMNSWVSRADMAHADIIAIGMQESTYEVKGDASASLPVDADTEKELKQNAQLEKKASVDYEKLRKTHSEYLENHQDEPEEDKEDPEAGAAEGQADATNGAPGDESGERHLIQTVKNHVGEGFKVVAQVKAWQMRIRVYVRTSLEVSEVEYGSENTGFAHVVANKGGQVVKFKIGSTSLCFVSCHLAAHEGKKSVRNDNIDEILRGCRLGDKSVDIASQFHHIFWFGDMNYRIDIPNTEKQERYDKVTGAVANKDWAALRPFEELKQEVDAGRALSGFHSAPLDFEPTFKVARSNGYTYEKKRTPSYCDRILWKSLPPFAANIQCNNFQPCPAFATSDHKPVFAKFSITPSPESHVSAALVTGGPHEPQEGFQLQVVNLKATGLKAADEGLTVQLKASAKVKSKKDRKGFITNYTVGKAKADPYVTFKVDPPEMAFFDLKGRQTEVISQDLDPTWEKKILLSLKATAPEDLAGASLRFTINDHDTFSFDDSMGVVVLPLEDICRAPDGKFTFSEPVLSFGQRAGNLQGEIIVCAPGTGDPDSPDQVPTTCACTIS